MNEEMQDSSWSNSWWDAIKFLCWFSVAWVQGVFEDVKRVFGSR